MMSYQSKDTVKKIRKVIFLYLYLSWLLRAQHYRYLEAANYREGGYELGNAELRVKEDLRRVSF